MLKQDTTNNSEAGENDSGLLKIFALLATTGAVAIAVLAIYTAGFGALPPSLHRTYGLLLAGIVLVLGKYNLATIHGVSRGTTCVVYWCIDILLLAALSIAIIHFDTVYTAIQFDFYYPVMSDILIAFMGLFALMEISRRIWGMPLLVITLLFLCYLIWGDVLPRSVAHVEFSAARIVSVLWYGYEGVFSTIVGVVLNLVWVFIVFGLMLETTGGGASLLRISVVLTGRTRGGPAHAAIVASSMFGTMSGSTVANVVGTGTFTIPMILKRGFSKRFAAGLEATASSGGQILPPIMGAAAFVMADLTGTPYLMICLAALVPALLYYFNLFVGVSIEARKDNIVAIPRDELPVLDRSDLFKSLLFVLPVISVIATLVLGYSPSFAGFVAVLVAITTGLFNPDVRKNPAILVKGLARAGVSAASVLIAIAMIGVIIATMNITGAGLKFASYIELLGSGSLFLSLILTMMAALLLGMGMPTLPAYLVIIMILGTAIELMGLSKLTIHMFVLYYGVASAITPPVALASYAAASISGSPPLKASLTGFRLGAPMFIIPFIFVFNPTLLIVETFDGFEFVHAMIRAILALYLTASTLSGYDYKKLAMWELAIRAAVVIGLLQLNQTVQYIALAGGVVLVISHYMSAKTVAKPAALTSK